ncbi:MAG: molybdenum cofactor biosynthesis protein MoaE [Phycisphaerales bacterium JB063]
MTHTSPANVTVQLVQGPLGQPIDWRPAGAGAVVQFEGVVRPTESGRRLRGLTYEAYEPMTSRLLDELGQAIVQQHGLAALHVEHSVGFIENHAVSFRLYVASAHRKEALAAMDHFIDRMKQTVPLWKVPEWEQGDG